MDSTKFQSGGFDGDGQHMSKRGSAPLRNALMTAADGARRFDPYFGDYYDSQTDRAIDFAYEAHAGQVRKPSVLSDEKVPYIFHPFVMACHAHALGIRDDAVLATALLHDVCEDCGIASDDLPFSDDVRRAVALLTKPASKEDYSPEAYYGAIAENGTAAIVKALDRCSNVSTMMASFPVCKVVSYMEETERNVIPLLDVIKKRYPEYYDAAFAIKYQIYSTIESIKAAIMRL